MNHLNETQANAVAALLDLGSEVATALRASPTKPWEQVVPTDPLIYRRYEIFGVDGETIKEVVQEKFGDGIMSAIDFTMDIKKQVGPRGDRVVVTLNGKFLPYEFW